MKVPVLVLVVGGSAYTYAPNHAEVHVIDKDCLEVGDPLGTLPRGIGFEELVKYAGLEEGKDFNWEGA